MSENRQRGNALAARASCASIPCPYSRVYLLSWTLLVNSRMAPTFGFDRNTNLQPAPLPLEMAWNALGKRVLIVL